MNALAEQTVVENRRPESALVALSSPPDPLWAPVVIRLATTGDRRAIERLAQLDSARPPLGQTLLGELQGRPVAAVSLQDGSTIADPFVPARDIVELVRLRARQFGLRPRSQRVRGQ
jgi:hypothetical protein